MKLKAQLAHTEHELTLDSVEERIVATVDGRRYELEVTDSGDGEYLLFSGTNVFRCRVTPARDSRNSFAITVRGRSYDIQISDPKRLRSGDTAGAHEHGAAEIVSPMPGKVVRLLVKSGAQVEAGDGIVVVEAMKMQNELKSPKAGVVVSINCETGATVNAGDVLAVIE